MLLQRIELKGFLSHYGRRNGAGDFEPLEIDFHSSPLWLIYGPNGSGKSALFDAITFALFKEHRGGGRDFYPLIHDAAEKAEINLEIILDGQSYLIQRTITRTQRKIKGEKRTGAEVWGIVRRRTEGEWQAVAGTTNNIEGWVEKNLRMSYKTFVSAVLLRQGEADAFLKAEAAQRKSRLLELLDLQFYEKLGEAANSHYNDYRKETKRRQEELVCLPKTSNEELATQRQIITEVEETLSRVKQILTVKDAALADARRAANLIAEIAQKEKQQQADTDLIEKANIILAAARRYRDLSSNLPLLDNLWMVRHRLVDEVESIKTTNQLIIGLQDEQEKLSPQLLTAKQDESAACTALAEAEAQLAQAQRRQQELILQVKQLQEIESLEQKIREAEQKLKPYKLILERADEIEQNYHRYEELRDVVPQLRILKTANAQSIEAKKKFEESQIVVAKWQEELLLLTAEEAQCRSLAEAATHEHEEIQKALQEYQNQIVFLQSKLADRDKVADKEECPVCGSRLDSEEARARLQYERSCWEDDLAKLEEQKVKHSQQLTLNQQAKLEAQNKLTTAVQATRNADIELVRAQSDFDNAQGDVLHAQKALHEAQQQTGAWVTQLDVLDTLEAELDELKISSEDWRKLGTAKQMESAAQATINTCQAQLDDRPKWSDEERQHVQSDAAKSAATVADYQREKETARTEANARKSHREDLEKQQQKFETDLHVAQNKLEDLNKRRLQAEQEAKKYQKVLPQAWANHFACEDEIALEKLKGEFAELSDAETEENRLHEAQARANELAGGTKILQSQLEAIPANHRRSVPEIEAELESAREEVKQSEDKLKEAQQLLMSMESQKQIYEERKKERDAAEKELGYYKKLSDAFGRGGLQAKIVQVAQEEIKAKANTTLDRLSNGRWQIELEEKTQNELEILARDLYQPPGTPSRSFEYLSGGEKFRVAISLAIAIGQTASGGRTVDTLVIDEGFGALDEVNRELLVTELHRLSEEVLRGGRVIIVSHQEDVCEKFESRYRISKDENNTVKIEYNSI